MDKKKLRRLEPPKKGEEAPEVLGELHQLCQGEVKPTTRRRQFVTDNQWKVPELETGPELTEAEKAKIRREKFTEYKKRQARMAAHRTLISGIYIRAEGALKTIMSRKQMRQQENWKWFHEVLFWGLVVFIALIVLAFFWVMITVFFEQRGKPYESFGYYDADRGRQSSLGDGPHPSGVER